MGNKKLAAKMHKNTPALARTIQRVRQNWCRRFIHHSVANNSKFPETNNQRWEKYVTSHSRGRFILWPGSVISTAVEIEIAAIAIAKIENTILCPAIVLFIIISSLGFWSRRRAARTNPSLTHYSGIGTPAANLAAASGKSSIPSYGTPRVISRLGYLSINASCRVFM